MIALAAEAEAEARFLWMLTAQLRRARTEGNEDGFNEALDNLQVLLMHTKKPAIRQRALSAIASAMPGGPEASLAPDGNLVFSFT